MSELNKRIISSIILLPTVFYFIIKGSYYFTFLIMVAFIICLYEWYLLTKNKTHTYLGLIFLIFSFFCIYKLRINNDDSYVNFIIIMSICILTDIGGYVFGKLLGGPKLTKLSPNKTYTGAMGGYVLTLTLVPFIELFNIFNNFIIFNFVLFALLVSTVSQCGDIFISYFKRISKIKNTGNLIPGHGGLLDRIDGMIFAYPFSYFLIMNDILSNFQ